MREYRVLNSLKIEIEKGIPNDFKDDHLMT